MNGCAPGLALIERLKKTQKWAIMPTLVLISFERLQAVVEPCCARFITIEGALRKLIAMWVSSIIIAIAICLSSSSGCQWYGVLHTHRNRRHRTTDLFQYPCSLVLHLSSNVHDLCPEEHFSIVTLGPFFNTKRS